MQLCKAKVEPLCFNFSWFSRGYSNVCKEVNKGILYSIQKLKCILNFQVAMLNRKVILTLWRALNTHYILDFVFLKLLILYNTVSQKLEPFWPMTTIPTVVCILTNGTYFYSGLDFGICFHLFPFFGDLCISEMKTEDVLCMMGL